MNYCSKPWEGSFTVNSEDYRKKHQPIFQNQGKKGNMNYCVGCKGPNGTLIQKWPCDVIRALDA